MQENPSNLALRSDLLALNVMLEAARCGDAGRDIAQHSARLRALSQDLRQSKIETGPDVDADNLLCWLQQRLESIDRRWREIGSLANRIDAQARCRSGALQFEDVESRVVVYSKQDVRELRTQLARIDATRQALLAAIAADQDLLLSTRDAVENRLHSQRRQSESSHSADR